MVDVLLAFELDATLRTRRAFLASVALSSR